MYNVIKDIVIKYKNMEKEEMSDKERLDNIFKYIEIAAENTENLKNYVMLLSKAQNINQKKEENIKQQTEKKQQQTENSFVDREIKKNNNTDISTLSV